MRFWRTDGYVAAFLLIGLVGCSSQPESPPDSSGGSEYLLTAEPSGAQEVVQAISDAGADEEVVVVGRIGGEVNPWVEGLAAFSIVDRKLKACSDVEGDNCSTPWDYCCEADLAKSKTLVEIVDGNGSTVKADARQLLKLKELQTVVVKGKAARDEANNLTVLATGVYVMH
ncbi:MAG: hypothetical protein H8E44_01885 [Planctomycetes bacterium]|nr:hypothetical protein [Planctomycetota bacterium]